MSNEHDAAQAAADEFNCKCGGPIHVVMGVERCQHCGKLAGGSIFVPFGSPLPPRASTRKRVSSRKTLPP